MTSTKAEIRDYLEREGVEVSTAATKAKLLEETSLVFIFSLVETLETGSCRALATTAFSSANRSTADEYRPNIVLPIHESRNI
ncbi:unnamed protein product [Cylicocyclus nassatus]|uniref:Uncharacterized protein n=1 Tax=Cylicocyclus nassatus TaxID=53992 RepID=A0AA36GFT2_CYLNA|nr:unnamed protein product [Cylicocyclus nassatus]